jgi:hypothetical protein
MRRAVPFLPAAGVLVTWIALMPADGGYFPRDWLPAGMIVVGLWLLATVGGGRLIPAGIPERVALGALAALCALAFLSTGWAEVSGTAFEAATKFLTVVLAAWTIALAPWRSASAHLLMVAFAAGATFAVGDALLSAVAATDLTERFIDGRWAEPIGYPNGLGNFGFFAALPALAVSASAARGIATRTLALTLATFLSASALLPQSRGAVLALLAGAIVLVAFSPLRWRVVARLAVVAAAMALASEPVFAVLDAAEEGTGVGDALDDAVRALLLVTLGGAVAGLVLALLESRVRVGEGVERAGRVAGFAAVGLVVLGAVGAAAVNADRIDRFVERQRVAWEGSQGETFQQERTGSSRLLNDDPLQRYEYWHVSLDAFRSRPLAGVGAGGFEARYIRDRDETKYSAYPHSLFMRALAEGGVLGVLGMLAFLGAVLAGVLRGLRHAGREDRIVTAAALAAGVCFLLHAQLDWLEEFPTLAGPAIAFLLVAAVVRRRETGQDEAPPGRLGIPAIAAAVVVAVLALVAVAPPYAALRYRERAMAIWRTDTAKAYRDLDRAAGLDWFGDLAHLSEGTIALQRDDLPRARKAFEAAIERDDNWLARFELAVTLAAQGDEEAATRQLEKARSLNPQEPAITAAQEAIDGEEAIDPVRLNRRLFESPLFKPPRLT